MKKLVRIKKTKVQFNKEQFYIYKTNNNIYHFRERGSHLVLSTSGSLEELLVLIKKVFTKYKHYDLFQRSLGNLSESGVSDKSLILREKEYNKGARVFETYLEEVINDFYREDNVQAKKVRPLPVPKIHVENSPREEVVTPPMKRELNKKRKSRL